MKQKRKKRSTLLSLLNLLHQALTEHDRTFLQRQLCYQVIGSTELPPIAADELELSRALNDLLLLAATRSPPRSKLEFRLESGQQEEKPGVVMQLTAGDSQAPDTLKLNSCQQLLSALGGHLSSEALPRQRIRYRLFFPIDEGRGTVAIDHKHYCCDIQIAQFLLLRKRYGVRKCAALVNQVLQVIRSMVRHPRDTVLANPDSGSIAICYEAPEQGASSVTSRLSQRLMREAFCIGKKMEPISFRYHLKLHEGGR